MNRRRTKLIKEIVNRHNVGSITDVELLFYYKKSKRAIILNWVGLLTVDLISSTLLEYLRLNEIAKLDSAILNHDRRINWLQCLHKFNFALASLKDIKSSKSTMDWIILKKLHFEELEFSIDDSFTNVAIFNKIMYGLAEQSPNLKSVKFQNQGSTDKVHNKSLYYLAILCSKLESISTFDLVIHDEDLVALGMTCRNLKYIKFRLPSNDTIPESGILELLGKCRSIIHFEIDFNIDAFISMHIDNSLFYSMKLNKLGTCCGQLETLDLRDFSDVNGRCAEVFAKGCPRLKSIVIHSIKNHEVFVKYFQALSSHCRLLESVDIKTTESVDTNDERIITALRSNLPLLRQLILAGEASEQFVQMLIENCPLLDDPCFKISVSSFHKLRHFKNLKCVYPSQFYGFQSWDDISGLLTTKGQNLEFVSLGQYMSDATLIFLGDNCPNLTAIFSSFEDKNATSLGIIYIFKKCKSLTKFAKGDIPFEISEEYYDRQKCKGKNNLPNKISRKCAVVDNQNIPFEDRKLFKIISSLVQVDSMSEADFTSDCNKAKRILNLNWIGLLLTRDWFSSHLLQYLSIFEIAKVDTSICNVVWRRTWLHSLETNFVDTPMQDVKWSKAVIDWVLLKKLHFNELDINVCEWSTDVVMSSQRVFDLALQCHNLTRLALSDARSLPERSYYFFDDYTGYRTLVTKEAAYAKYNTHVITDDIILSLFAICHQLEGIAISNIPLDFHIFKRVGQSLHQLKSINLQLPSNTQQVWAADYIFEHTPNLTSIELSSDKNAFRSNILAAISRHCLLLESVSLDNILHDDDTAYEDYGDNDVDSRAHIDMLAKGCPKLKSVKIHFMRSPGILLKYLQALGTHCHAMEELMLGGIKFSGFDETAENREIIQTFTVGCPLLKKLIFTNLPGIFDCLVHSLADNCLSLEALTMPLTQTGLIEIRRIRQLKHLDFVNVGQVSEEDVVEVLERKGQSLEYLGINSNYADGLLRCIADNCPNLIGLNFRGPVFNNISREDYLYLFHRCKSLSTMDPTTFQNVPDEVLAGLKKRKK